MCSNMDRAADKNDMTDEILALSKASLNVNEAKLVSASREVISRFWTIFFVQKQ